MGQLIDRLGGMGCKFALDNFGSGLSSFSFIKNLKIDYIKIDGNLVRDISEDAIDRAMVESINTMGHLLGIRTIAECADSESSIQALKSLGIDYAQGFYLGNPVSMDEFGGAKATLSRNSRAPVN
jgi:Amt family ammonium transporter